MSTRQLVQIAGTVPAYLKVARLGTTFTAYTSSDGVTWTPIAGSTITLSNLGGTILASLAVTSHLLCFSIATVSFRNVPR